MNTLKFTVRDTIAHKHGKLLAILKKKRTKE